ncbi:hypothetical protein [Streptomyces sp. NPDC007369]|uniref:hypothetical protein n=1 Tax=Streptomyces sp. NPDC007369 TaxID=3154589 RepID=UPI0033C1F766
MRNRIYTAVAVAAALLATASPAQASGGAQAGPVGIGVIGSGLRVKEVRALLDGWEPGARARVSLWRGGRFDQWVTQWKATASRDVAGYKHEFASWKLNRDYPHKSRLCVEFEHTSERPCVTIQR